MSQTIIAFVVGVFVGVMGGIFIIGILQMARERIEFHAEKPTDIHAFLDN